jgi:hypothetical protein
MGSIGSLKRATRAYQARRWAEPMAAREAAARIAGELAAHQARPCAGGVPPNRWERPLLIRRHIPLTSP